MNTEVAIIVRNAEALALFARTFSDEHLPCLVHCPDDNWPEVQFLGCDADDVFKVYGVQGWTRYLNHSRTAYDLVAWRCGVRLVIRNVERVPVPQLEGPIRAPESFAHT